jgi:Uma2 family endonuclease
MSTAPNRVPPGPIKLTYDEYVELPNDGQRYEVLDGELAVTPAPTTTHQVVSRNLEFMLHAHALKTGAGAVYDAPIDVLLAPTTIVQPDLVFVTPGRQGIVTERAVEGAPDLLVEILSPSTTRQDRVTKAALYARFGVRFYWIVDPAARTLEEYALALDSYWLVAVHSGPVVARTELFPDLDIDLTGVWP